MTMTETSAPPRIERPARARLNPLVVVLAVIAAVLLLLWATSLIAALHYHSQYTDAVEERNTTVKKANAVIGDVKVQRDQLAAGQEALLQQVTTCQVLMDVNKHLNASVDASIEGVQASEQNNQKWLAGRMREVQRQLRAANGAPREAGFENTQELALACAGQEGPTS
jgi:hypothetical protein